MTINKKGRSAAYDLLEAGALVNFNVDGTDVHESPDPAEFSVQLQLRFPPDSETEQSDLEWGALGFLFVLGMLSFADARPRGMSEDEYDENDTFGVDDLINGLRWEGAPLRFSADYVRGRRMKTTVVLRADGTGTLTTAGRGMTAQRWLDSLQGKNGLYLVPKNQPIEGANDV